MNVTLTLTIPAKIDAGETSPKYRGVKFISPAVQGLEAAERCTGGAAPNCAGSAVGNAQTRVPGAGAGENQQILYYVASSVCNNASPRVCTITFPSYAPAAGQTAQFEIDLLDTAPPSNASAGGPASANLLGAGLTLPGQTPSGNTSLTITTFEGIVGSVIFPATSSTGTVHDGAGSNFGNIGNAKLQINFGAGSIFIASYVGAGNGNGIAISGFGFNVAQDVRANLIGTASSGCAVSGPDEYGNSLTPSGSNDTNDLQNNSTRSGVYAQLTPTSGQSAQHYAGEVLTGEAYAGATNPLLAASVRPCGQGMASSFSPSGAGNASAGIAGANFPGDFFSWQYNPTNKAPTVSNPVSGNGGQTGEATNLFSYGPSAPYFSVFAAATQAYDDASLNYNAPSLFFYWINQLIYGEAYVPAGSNGTITCLQSGGGNQTTSGAPAEAFDAGPAAGSAGSIASGGACSQGMVVNLFGTSNGTATTAFVYALQNWKPTGGAYTATPNGNCNGVVSVSAPTGNLFQSSGVLASDGSTVIPYGSSGAKPGNGGGAFWNLTAGTVANANTSIDPNSAACVVTFSDAFNSFKVTITNAPGTDSAFSCPTSDSPSSFARAPAGETDALRRAVAHHPRQTQDADAGLIAATYDRATFNRARSTLTARERTLGANLVREFDFAHTGLVTRVLRVPASQRASVEALLRAQPGVRSVAATGARRFRSAVTQPYFPNDPYFNGFGATYHVGPYEENASLPGQWGMHAIKLESAFAYSQSGNGSGIVNANALGSAAIKIAVIDTGQDTGHPELNSKIVYQRCYITNSVGAQSTSNFTTDPDGHGTDVSGIAAAATNNSFGFTGAGGNVSLMAYRIFPTPDDGCLSGSGGRQCGASTVDLASAIDDAVAHGANVISMSLGGGQCSNGQDNDPTEGAALANAIAANVVVVAAAGNSSGPPVEAPACVSGVLAAGATSLADGSTNGSGKAGGTPSAPIEYVTSYTDYGSPGAAFGSASAWGIVAPGGDPGGGGDADNLHWIENIWTSTPFDSNFAGECTDDYPNSTLKTPPVDCRILIAGTSMATPHVAGAAALILSVNGAYQSPAKMKQLLCSTADDIGDAHEGCGRLNVYRAMATALNDPSPP